MTHPRIPADSPPEHLAAWAHSHPELRTEIAAHPNAYPELVAWIHEQAASPPGGGRRRLGIAVAGATALAVIAGGIAGAVVLLGGDDPDRSAGAGGTRGTVTSVGDGRPSILGEPGVEWVVDVRDLVDAEDPRIIDPLEDVESATVWLFEETAVVTVAAGESGSRRLVALDTRDGSQRWGRNLAEREHCSQALDTQEKAALIFCRHWTDAGDPGRLVLIDPASGVQLSDTETDFRVDGVVVEDDGSVLVHGPHGDWPDTSMGISHGTVEDPDADWSHVHPDPGFAGEPSPHWVPPTVTAQSTNWVIEQDQRHWAVDATSGALVDAWPGDDRTWRTPLTDGTWLESDDAGATLRDGAGDPVWEAPGAWPQVVSPETVKLTYVDDDHNPVGTELRDLRSGELLWEVDASRTVELTSHDDLVLVCCGDTAEVRDARTGETRWHTKSQPMRGRFDDPAAVPQWNTANGMFDVWQADGSGVAWSRNGFATNSDPDHFLRPYAASRHGVLVAVSRHTVHGFTDFGPPPAAGSTTADDPTYVTPCGSTPEFEPVAATAQDGGVSIEFVVRARCPGGQWLSGSDVRLVVDAAGEAGTVALAEGLFDFSDAPLWIPGDGEVTLQARFPIGRLWATEREIEAAIDTGTIRVECIEEDPASLPEPEDSAPDDGAEIDSAEAGTSTDERDDREENSLEALRRLAAEDLPYALDEIAGSWVPQLSSKQDGTHDSHEAKTYDYTDIYEQHLDLRLRYPGVRLLWSGDWGTFAEPNFWITVAGVTSSDAEPALEWCDDEGFVASQCYAKLIREDGPSEDTTRLRKD